jgi:two-component system OmpR family sensor kinase
LAVAAGAVLLLLAVIAAFLPLSIKTSEIDEADRQLTSAVPLAEEVSNSAAPMSAAASTLSAAYVARVSKRGARAVLVRPLTIARGAPKEPATTSRAGEGVHPETVGSLAGSQLWRATMIRTGSRRRLLVAIPVQLLPKGVWPVGVFALLLRLLVLFVVVMVGWWLVRLGLRPMAEVTRVADAITSGDRSRRVAEGVPGTEAAELARAFNEMLDAQHAAEDRLRRFVADASHELRTPVTAISGFADLYRHGGIDTGHLDEVMRRIGQEAARMRGLVEDMLLLARLDEGHRIDRKPVDIASLARDAVLDAHASYPSRRVSVTGDAPAIVAGDEAGLRQVLANLVTNALVHGDGYVAVTIAVAADEVSLVVSNAGATLDPLTLERAFDRFWRGETARGRSGSGLGLPIVRGIVVAHGGTVTLTSSPGAGTRVAVVLPTAREPSGEADYDNA